MSINAQNSQKTPDQEELIVAVATASGQGGVGVVRLSGQGALQVAAQLVNAELVPRKAVYSDVIFEQTIIDQGIIIAYPTPHSFTGEDVVEFQMHGSPIVLQQIISISCSLGARLAHPGEFSQRAFINGKVDLAQAEAIADLISSRSLQAARAAVASLTGVFSDQVKMIAAHLEKMRVLVEASIDFPEEEQDFLAEYNVLENCADLDRQVSDLLANAKQGQMIATGCTAALMGSPNVGKSSLLNCLAGEQAAIVTDIPGTTRDLLKVDLVLNGLPIKLVDTAGLRDSNDVVEQEGIRRARNQIGEADIILLMVDLASDEDVQAQIHPLLHFAHIDADDDRLLIIGNKADISERVFTDGPSISAKLESGIDSVIDQICSRVGFAASETPFTARTRHVDALIRCQTHVQQAMSGIKAGMSGELIAEDLHIAHIMLGEIVGTVSADDLLGKIFSEFCIGK